MAEYGNVFNMGNSLMRGAQMGAMMNQARASQQNALIPDMGGTVGGVLIGGVPKAEYNARRTVIEDQREDLAHEQALQDRDYAISRRPVAEAQAQADVRQTVAEISKVNAETGKLAAEAAAIGGEEARKQTQAESALQAVEYRAWAQAGAQALRSGQWAAYVGGFSEVLAAIDGEGGITPEMVMDENNAEMVLAFVSSFAAGLQDPEGAAVFSDSDFIERMNGGGQAEEPSSIQALRIRAQEAGLKPGAEAYQEFMRTGGKIDPSRVVYGADGQPVLVEGAAAGNIKLTEQQSKDNVYAVRARGALEMLEPVANTLSSLPNRAANLDPTGLSRGLQSDDFQVAEQAGTEFLQAILRKDTGAAITTQETDSYGKVYLPQVGDGDAVLEAKRQARIRAINALESGMSAQQMMIRDRALVKAAEEAEAAGQPAQSKPEPTDNPYIGLSEQEFLNLDLSTMTPEEIEKLFEARQ